MRPEADPDRGGDGVIPAEGADGLPGADVRTPDDALLGTVGDVVGEDGSGDPAWASVVTDGADQDGPVVVPLANAVTEDDAVRLPFGHETVLGAPRPVDPEAMTTRERSELESWYGAFTSAESAEGWVAPQDLPDVPFTVEDDPQVP